MSVVSGLAQEKKNISGEVKLVTGYNDLHKATVINDL